jgi:hypothetical protein
MLWLHVEVPVKSGIDPPSCSSPLVVLGHVQGCNEDEDAPPRTCRMKPGERFRFPAQRAFIASLFCGLSDLWIGCALDVSI